MESRSLETVPSGVVHLDTVRSLHQTVVSLRTALEVSKNELKELKEKYHQHSQCLEYADVIEKLKLENNILRQKIVDSECDQEDCIKKSRFLNEKDYSELEELEDFQIKAFLNESDTSQPNITKNTLGSKQEEHVTFYSADELNEVSEDKVELSDASENEFQLPDNFTNKTELEDSHSAKASDNQETKEYAKKYFNTKLELLSKFDVRIKVKSVNEDRVLNSTSDSDSTSQDVCREEKFKETAASIYLEEKREHFENLEDQKGNRINVKTVSTDNIKMAVPNETESKMQTDKFDVQVRITSEESLIVEENIERTRRKDTLNLDVDDLSLRSLSEGDNSVFTQGAITPVDHEGMGDKVDNEVASGNESEEVDDIELIFTTDESKDMSNLQEDLVSIQESEQWIPTSASTVHSTPVLIKFHTLDPDFQPGSDDKDYNTKNENQENINIKGAKVETSLRHKRVSLPSDKDIKSAAFNSKGCLELPGRGILKSFAHKSDNMLYRRSPNTSTRRLDSVDSLSTDYKRGLSFDNTKSSSFELGSSMDILHRDESFDSFNKNIHLGHRFSVFAENDISKCGISEDDLSSNLNMRRNTCPNPFQYRPPPYRTIGRPGPLKASLPAGRSRPVLRESFTPRRDNGAQTDVSALPPRWSSDGYLAYNTNVSSGITRVTLPQRSEILSTRRLTVPDARPPPPGRRSDETRRVMLSDIGFTSMVPELSRSADPIWALSRRAPPENDPHTGCTSKFLSRGSSYRSPCLSVDRSNDWLPQTLYVPSAKVSVRPWRSSLPDVRRDDTDELIHEAETFLRRSIDNLRATSPDRERWSEIEGKGRPYIPAEPRHLRLGHAVKIIAPHGRIAIGRVRYVGIAGETATNSSFVVGAEFPLSENPGLPRNDGTHRGRRYFLVPPHYTALFVPFSKVVMAWAT